MHAAEDDRASSSKSLCSKLHNVAFIIFALIDALPPSAAQTTPEEARECRALQSHSLLQTSPVYRPFGDLLVALVTSCGVQENQTPNPKNVHVSVNKYKHIGV